MPLHAAHLNVDPTNLVRPGEENVIVMRTLNGMRWGGFDWQILLWAKEEKKGKKKGDKSEEGKGTGDMPMPRLRF